MARRKTWREKLADDKDLPKVITLEEKDAKRWGTGTMVVPAPREVDALMKTVPYGRVVTIQELRQALATAHQTTLCCPLTTGIFAWIAAHAAEESMAAGDSEPTPYWRTLKAGGEINPKYPGGAEAAKARLEAEGHRVVARGKRLIVENHEEHLAKLEPTLM